MPALGWMMHKSKAVSPMLFYHFCLSGGQAAVRLNTQKLIIGSQCSDPVPCVLSPQTDLPAHMGDVPASSLKYG